MTEFKKGDRVLVEAEVVRNDTVIDGTICVTLVGGGAEEHWLFTKTAQLAPDQPLKEGDQVITLAGSLGFIRAIYKEEAYVVLLNNPTRLSTTALLSHLRRAEGVDLKV